MPQETTCSLTLSHPLLHQAPVLRKFPTEPLTGEIQEFPETDFDDKIFSIAPA